MKLRLRELEDISLPHVGKTIREYGALFQMATRLRSSRVRQGDKQQKVWHTSESWENQRILASAVAVEITE